MKVLWITSAFPDIQGTGGMVHELELLRSVAPNNRITLLSTFGVIRPAALRTIQDLGVRVEVVPWSWQRAYVPRNKVVKFVRLLFGAAPNFEISVRHKRLEPLIEAIRREEEARPVEIVFVVQGEIAPVIEAAKAPTALLLYDIYHRQTALVSGGLSPRTIRYRMERRNAARWETFWYRKADAVACVSSVDAEVAAGMIGRQVETIVNPVPDEFFAPPEVSRSSAIVTLIGSLGWEPNTDSVRWMCGDIWPRVRSARPDARLRVVGRFGTPELKAMVEAVGGEFCGEVEDIRPYYWEAAVVVANIRMGSGMRNKVLHAMACRSPLVATPSALEGIDVAALDHVLVAGDEAGLADAIVATLNDTKAAAARAEGAVEVAAGYSSAAAGAALEKWWKSVAQMRAGAPTESRPAQPPSTASIVVCTREKPDVLRGTLATVGAAAARAPGTEIIVVEQGASSAAAICSELKLRARVISDHGIGVSRARNIGIRLARGDLVLFTDDDCEVREDWVLSHVEALRDPDVIASFGAVVGVRYDENYDPVALPTRRKRGSAPWLVGHAANMAARRATLVLVGGFDERMGPGTKGVTAGEDADLIVRLLRRGAVVTGAGHPVRHIDWRWSVDRRSKLIGYEFGAGGWIGKAMREEPRAALCFLVARVKLQRGTLRHAKDLGDSSLTMGAFTGAFGRGLIAGIRMKPWKHSFDEQAARADGIAPLPDSVSDDR